MRKDVMEECSVSVDCDTCCYLLGKSVLSDDFPVRQSGKLSVSFRKLMCLTKAVAVMKRIMNWRIHHCNNPVFTGEKYCFLHPTPIPTLPDTCFLAVSELCKDTPRIHWTIPWEKSTGESVLWVLMVIPVVTLTTWKCTVSWLRAKEWQEACFFQKNQIYDQSCCSNEEESEPVCFASRFEAETI